MHPLSSDEASARINNEITAGRQRPAQVAGQEQIRSCFPLAKVKNTFPDIRALAEVDPGSNRHARVVAYIFKQISRQLDVGSAAGPSRKRYGRPAVYLGDYWCHLAGSHSVPPLAGAVFAGKCCILKLVMGNDLIAEIRHCGLSLSFV
ncbi:hypothetical protein D3C75_637980 [compost metagenome]